jgi:hypothetical protein
MAKKFKRPPGWYRETVLNLVKDELPPMLGPLTTETAWRYVYAIVMWPEEKSGANYLHLQESNQLDTKTGKEFADRAKKYLESNLCLSGACDPVSLVNQLGKADDAERIKQGFQPVKKRDPNVTGTAFETVIQVLVGELCGVLPSRTPDLNTLQGFELAPIGYHSKPDLALFGPRDFRLLISTKWTLRKERIGTYLHEAYFYKQRRPDLQVAFVVSEFNMNIINWLSQDPLADRVYHVNKQMLLHLHDPFSGAGRTDRIPLSALSNRGVRRWLDISDRVFDLSNLFEDVDLLMSTPDAVLDPEVDQNVSEDDS